jgi:hypothetical protein
MRKITFLFILTFQIGILSAQTLRFVHVTDTHVGSGTGAEDLDNTVKDNCSFQN